jgi:hypothetical protein
MADRRWFVPAYLRTDTRNEAVSALEMFSDS